MNGENNYSYDEMFKFWIQSSLGNSNIKDNKTKFDFNILRILSRINCTILACTKVLYNKLYTLK